MSEQRLTRIRSLLSQARTLRADLLNEVDCGKLASDDIRMQHYNDIVTTAAGLASDPVLDKMPIMPDADLQGFEKWPWLQSVPIGDRVHRRLIAYLDRFIGRLEVLLGESSPPQQAKRASDALHLLDGDADVASIRAALNELRAAQSAPISLEARSFGFISEADVRAVLVADFAEAQRAFSSGANKACAILAAGVLEGMLLDILRSPVVVDREDYEDATQRLPRIADAINWDRVSLSHLIAAAEALALLSPPALQLATASIDYRNTVHPQAEVRLGQRPRLEEAELMLALCKLVYRDLAEVSERNAAARS